MMDASLKQMLVGTSKSGAVGAAPEGEVESLVAKAAPADAETRLLLTAGARAVYAQAGWKPPGAVALAEPAPSEELSVPSSRGAALLEELLTGEQRDLVPEALVCLRQAGLRLPEHLLPVALEDRDAKHRPYIAATLGARGAWLSRLNPDWAWATTTISTATERLPEDAEEIWDSGAIDQREALLRQMRRLDRAQGREWLRKSWAGEKADHRSRLLAVLETGLSSEDAAFLEEALTDRAMRVRAEAAGLLVRITGSAFAARVAQQVDACLGYKPAAGGGLAGKLKSLVGRKNKGELTASPPQDVDAAWKKEGIIPAPPQGVGPRAWWLSRMIGLVPPAHWQERFGLPPADLLSTSIADEWEAAVVTGWTLAALLHEAADWLPPLWDHWAGAAGARGDERLMGTDAADFLGPVLARMPPEDSAPRIEPFIREGRAVPFGWFRAMEFLPRPWAPGVARAYLQHVRGRARKAPQVSNVEVQSLGLAAKALPPDCFDEAMVEWGIPEGDDYQLQHWRREIRRFTEIVFLRQRFRKELTRP